MISSKDARAVVMRNGIEIGRARVAITEPEKPFGTHVFVAKEGFLPTRHTSAPDLPLHHWVTTGITGHLDESGQTPDPDSMHRIRIPPTFLREVYPLLRPGSTLVITDAPILENSTGANLTLFDTRPPGK